MRVSLSCLFLLHSLSVLLPVSRNCLRLSSNSATLALTSFCAWVRWTNNSSISAFTRLMLSLRFLATPLFLSSYFSSSSRYCFASRTLAAICDAMLDVPGPSMSSCRCCKLTISSYIAILSSTAWSSSLKIPFSRLSSRLFLRCSKSSLVVIALSALACVRCSLTNSIENNSGNIRLIWSSTSLT